MSLLIPDYNSPAKLGAYLESCGLGMRKKYGQNFLINPAAREKLLDSLEAEPGDEVWEIGPGLGAMTKGLLDRGAMVTAFEIDPGFIRILKGLYGHLPNFNLAEGDVLKTWPAANPVNNKNLSLLGNLPYNIAAVLLADFLEKKRYFKKMVITVQFETAQRLMAKPGTSNYSSLTVLNSVFYRIRPVMVIKGASFYPVPRVNSQGLRFDLLEPPKDLPGIFYPMLRSLFSSRRKTLQNNLSGFVSSVIIKNHRDPDTAKSAAKKNGAVRSITADVFSRTSISGGRRAETMDIDEFIRMAGVLSEVLAGNTEELTGNDR